MTNNNCKCYQFETIEGQQANEFSTKYLQEICVNSDKWEITYKCLACNQMWVLSYPQS